MKPVIVWFRQDLRVADNPALAAAADRGAPLLPVYVLDDEHPGRWRMGAASRWWLHRSLERLDESLHGRLCLLRGPADREIVELVKASGATAVYWNRCYEPWRIARDSSLVSALEGAGTEAHEFDDSLLFEPGTVSKADGTPYRVFTPYFRNGCLANAAVPPRPEPAPSAVCTYAGHRGLGLDELSLLPAQRWFRRLEAHWSPGEAGALERLDRFLANGLPGYRERRDRPDLEHVSRLSPHLRFGEISVRRVWHEVRDRGRETDLAGDVRHFLAELGWREFSYYQLFHWPDLPRANLREQFDRFPWRDDAAALERWQRGRTGVPIVDAGMRELWQTGYMHNRVRMITASFLVKNLLLHWHHGADWFWDTLVDADLANNSANWQWVAGCGLDAAPYFRIFNPVAQGRRFDPHGDYVRRYVPELASLPDRHVHEPWAAPEAALREAGIDIGTSYPSPLVDLKASRERALAAFATIRRDKAG